MMIFKEYKGFQLWDKIIGGNGVFPILLFDISRLIAL